MAFTAVTLAAFLAAHGCVPEPAIDLIVAHAMWENPHGDPNAINHNKNGTDDYGLAMVNTVNFGWTGLTRETAGDPCKNMLAGLKVAIAAYNGNGSDAQKIAYTNGVLSNMRVHVGASAADAVAIPFSAPPVVDTGVHDAVHVHVRLPATKE